MKKLDKYRISRSKNSGRKGVVYIWTIVVLMLLIMVIGLSLDMGKVILVAHQLQNAADAAALAGARVVRIDQTQSCQYAVNTAYANYADGQNVQLADNEENDPDGDIVVGRYDMELGIFIPTTVAANALKVVVKRSSDSLMGPVTLNFGSLFNIENCDLTRYAIAVAVGGTGAGMISLSSDGIGMLINGSLSLDVKDGAIIVNSTADNAVRIIGHPTIDALELNITGDIDVTGGFEFDPNFIVNTGTPPVDDPLCPDPLDDCLPEPSWDPAYDLSPSPGEALKITGGIVELEPGYYSGGLNINGGDVTLKPGIYILDGTSHGQESGLVIGGNANFCAKGVMFYIVGDGVVDISGTGSVVATPIQYDDTDFCDASYEYPINIDYTYEYLTIFQARDNLNEARIVGTGLLDFGGTLYFPNNHINLSGTGEGFGDQLIADTIEFSGTGNMVVRYDGRNRSPATRSFLVE